MREILFRGRRTDNGEWVYGNLIVAPRYPDLCMIEDRCPVERSGIMVYQGAPRVDPATIGQYTGLTDKNGKKIFEGDIIKSHYANSKKPDHIETVVFNLGRFCACKNNTWWSPLADGVPRFKQDKSIYMEWCEVIGNIHDNPELLRKE